MKKRRSFVAIVLALASFQCELVAQEISTDRFVHASNICQIPIAPSDREPSCSIATSNLFTLVNYEVAESASGTRGMSFEDSIISCEYGSAELAETFGYDAVNLFSESGNRNSVLAENPIPKIEGELITNAFQMFASFGFLVVICSAAIYLRIRSVEQLERFREMYG